MSLLRLAVCVVGVYSMFLLWAIAQERLSVPFLNTDGTKSERFRSALIMSTCQSAFSVVSSFIYIFVRRKPGETLYAALGLEPTHVKSNAVTPYKSSQNESVRDTKMNGNGNAATIVHPTELETAVMRRALLTRYLQCALFITAAAPFGFAALAHISYPAMVLGKSCKLVPVLLMNVLLYHRRFACHKYVVVALVTAGITMFMGLGDKGSSKGHGSSGSMEEAKGSNTIGIMYLLINLAIDGATNSTQDEIFKRYAVTGQQMMFWINLMSTFVTTALALLPLPYIPVLHPSEGWSSELANVSTFIREHPEVASPLAQFALTGAMGQLFIFETLQHFGSLTLVMITLTRKLFTMILSVIVYNHKLTTGQWAGAAVVFAGISVEAWVKRKDVHAKRVMQEKEKAEIKSL